MMNRNNTSGPISIEYLEYLTGKELFDTIIEAVGYGLECTGVRTDTIKVTEETYITKFIWIEQRLKECGIVLEIV